MIKLAVDWNYYVFSKVPEIYRCLLRVSARCTISSPELIMDLVNPVLTELNQQCPQTCDREGAARCVLLSQEDMIQPLLTMDLSQACGLVTQ